MAVSRVEYLSQLIQVETLPLPPEVIQEIEKAKKKRQLKHELRLSIQEKLSDIWARTRKKAVNSI